MSVYFWNVEFFASCVARLGLRLQVSGWISSGVHLDKKTAVLRDYTVPFFQRRDTVSDLFNGAAAVFTEDEGVRVQHFPFAWAVVLDFVVDWVLHVGKDGRVSCCAWKGGRS